MLTIMSSVNWIILFMFISFDSAQSDPIKWWALYIQNEQSCNALNTSVFPILLLPRGITYLVLPLDAKIGQKVNKIDNWWHPWNYVFHGTLVCRGTPVENHWPTQLKMEVEFQK